MHGLGWISSGRKTTAPGWLAWVIMTVVFGLGRIFRLERSAIFMTEFWARLELGAIHFHVYMGENRFSLWSYHIGTVFKRRQLSFDIYKVSNHHFIHDIHQMTSGLPNLYKFQWAITSSLSYVEYWPETNKTVLVALWWLMWHSNTLQLPSESCSSSPCVMIMSHCSEGGFR